MFVIKRIVFLYLALVCAPTLVIGTAAFVLLKQEHQRLESRAGRTVERRLELVAERIQTVVADVEDQLMDALGSIPQEELVEELRELELNNPLVRNVFVWNESAGFIYPDPGRGATLEERRFLERYAELFSNQKPWDAPVMDGDGSPRSGRIISHPSSRKKLAETFRSTHFVSGWKPWFSGSRIHLLGWIRKNDAARVYGMEMEFMVLLSRLVSLLPKNGDSVAMALVDGAGRIVHQGSGQEIQPGAKPRFSVSLAPLLPHWTVAAYYPTGLVEKAHETIILLFALIGGVFLAAILAGGGLLVWQANRNMLDARRKTSFVSNVSHELKTPLTSLRMFAELLRENRVSGDAKRREYLGVIVEESERLTRLVNNILDFGRLEQNRRKYNLERINVSELVNNFERNHSERIRSGGLVLKIEVPEQPLLITADRDALNQVMLNLADNALKYAAEGGELIIRVEQVDDRCLIEFLDRGPGVPGDHTERIFEKFYRVDQELTAGKSGSGLGLSIARGLLRGMGGDISYAARMGGGAQFIIAFPSDRPETQEEA